MKIQDIYSPFLLVLILILVLYLVQLIFLRSANRKVIQIFRDYQVTSKKNARSREELGLLGQQTFVQRMIQAKDYKPHATDFLTRVGAIKVTENDKMYLDEDTLMSLIKKKKKDKNLFKSWKFLIPNE